MTYLSMMYLLKLKILSLLNDYFIYYCISFYNFYNFYVKLILTINIYLILIFIFNKQTFWNFNIIRIHN